MDAVIIAGGLGTRLHPLTLKYPKTLIPFLDRPLITYLLDLVEQVECERLVLAVGHLRDELRDYFAGANANGRAQQPLLCAVKEVLFADENEPLGTGGALANAIRQLKLEGPLLVLNGDIVTDLAPSSLLSTQQRHHAPAVVAGYRVPNPQAFGLLHAERDDRVVSFDEKSENPGDPPYIVNTGIYYLGTPVVQELTAREGAFSLERDYFPGLVARGGLFLHRHGGFWSDVGALESYFNTQFAILRYWLTIGRENFGGSRDNFFLFKDLIYIHQGSQMGTDCELFHRVIVMGEAEIGDGCHLRDTIVLPGAKLRRNCSLSTVIVDRGTSLPPGTKAEHAVIGAKHQEPFFPHP